MEGYGSFTGRVLPGMDIVGQRAYSCAVLFYVVCYFSLEHGQGLVNSGEGYLMTQNLWICWWLVAKNMVEELKVLVQMG